MYDEDQSNQQDFSSENGDEAPERHYPQILLPHDLHLCNYGRVYFMDGIKVFNKIGSSSCYKHTALPLQSFSWEVGLGNLRKVCLCQNFCAIIFYTIFLPQIEANFSNEYTNMIKNVRD